MNSAQQAAVEPLQFKEMKRIKVEDILPNPQNPREPISRREIADLRKSIEVIGGILVPLVVYERGDGKFVLLDGERRWRAARELGMESVPVNIIAKPLSSFDNLRTMFNIHLQRKEWSTAARAVTLGRILELRKDLADNPRRLSEITGMSPRKIAEGKLLLKCPKDMLERCLSGVLNENYLIEIARGLDACFKSFPQLTEKYTWNLSLRHFVKKVDAGYVRNVTSARSLSRIAAKCVDLRADSLFLRIFKKLFDQSDYSFDDAESEVDDELGYKSQERFRQNCMDFLATLKAYGSHRKTIPPENLHLLDKIADTIKGLHRRSGSKL